MPEPNEINAYIEVMKTNNACTSGSCINNTGNTSKPGTLEKNEMISRSIGFGSFLNKNLRIKKQITSPTTVVTLVDHN